MISIVIPIYNEQEILPTLFERLDPVLKGLNDKCEIIIVDDGSADQSSAIVRKKVDLDPRYKLLQFSRNFGHQAAISCGIKETTGDCVVVMDGDLQDPPEEIPRFLAKWKEGYEVVYAVRRKRKEGILKRLAYRVYYRVLNMISDIEIPLDAGDFCVMDRKVADVMNNQMPEHVRFVRGLRAFVGFKQIGLTYERDKRFAGKEKYTFKKLMRLAMHGLIDFSTFPLRLASYMGFFIALSSFLIGALFILQRLIGFKLLGRTHVENPGLATVGIYFLGGIILIILGILGEYLGRIYYEVKQRPFYIVRESYKGSRK